CSRPGTPTSASRTGTGAGRRAEDARRAGRDACLGWSLRASSPLAPSRPPGGDLDDAQGAVGERGGEGFALAHELGAARITPQAGEEAVAGGEDLGGALRGLGGPVPHRELDESQPFERRRPLRRRGGTPAGNLGCVAGLGAHEFLDGERAAAPEHPMRLAEGRQRVAQAGQRLEGPDVRGGRGAGGGGGGGGRTGAGRPAERRPRRGRPRGEGAAALCARARVSIAAASRVTGASDIASALPQNWPGRRARAKLASHVPTDRPIRPPGPRPAWYRRLPASLRRVAA